MRVAVMWRHYGDRGGVAVYTESVLRALLQQDSRTEYVVFVPPGPIPAMAAPNLRVVEVDALTRLEWDQVAVPAAATREAADVVFNPKLSVPLRGPFRTAFSLHGLEQFVCARHYPLADRVYVATFMPLYCRHADAIFCPTEHVKSEILDRFAVASGKVHVTPYGLGPHFLSSVTPADLDRVRARHTLPEQFILFVGGLTPLKNFGGMLQAMAALRTRIPHDLVLSGFHRWGASGVGQMIEQLGLGERVRQIGWVDAADQPALYRLASALALPSLYEGFGFPVIEAMASGCPVVTSTGGSLPEVAGDAALLVDPNDSVALAEAIERVVCDRALAADLGERGYRRARLFRWEHVAFAVHASFRALCNGTGDSG